MEHDRAGIHPLAFVDDTVLIGARTKVWQFASVIRGAVLGEDCNIASSATIDGAIFGNGCIVCAGAFVGPGTLIGDGCFIGMSVSFCNDMWPSVDKDGFDIDQLRAGKWAVIVGDGSTIGANAVILPGVAIGRGAFVAAGAVVDRNVPDGFLWRRNGYLAAMPENRREKRMREATR